MKVLILMIFALFSCKNTEATSTENQLKNMENNTEIESVRINPNIEIDEKDLMYKMGTVTVDNNTLNVKVKYGGGCIKPHIFELVSDGVINENGFMNVYLLHKTHNDHCKALIMKDLTYDVSLITKLTSSKLKGLAFNGEQEFFLIEK